MDEFEVFTKSAEEFKTISLDLKLISCCGRCILRLLGEKRPQTYRFSVAEILRFLFPEDHLSSVTTVECTCPGCIGVLQKFAEQPFLSTIVKQVQEEGYKNAHYKCSLILPVCLAIRQKALFIFLEKKYPKVYSGKESLILSVKDTWKFSCGPIIASLSNLQTQNRREINMLLTFNYGGSDDRECAFLLNLLGSEIIYLAVSYMERKIGSPVSLVALSAKELFIGYRRRECSTCENVIRRLPRRFQTKKAKKGPRRVMSPALTKTTRCSSCPPPVPTVEITVHIACSSSNVFIAEYGNPDKDLAPIRKQMEFYFSNENLPNDKFLNQNMDSDKFIPLELFLNFGRIKPICNTVDQLMKAVETSSILEFSADRKKVRVSQYRKTLALAGIPLSATEEAAATPAAAAAPSQAHAVQSAIPQTHQSVQALMQPFSTIHPCIAGSPTGIYYQQAAATPAAAAAPSQAHAVQSAIPQTHQSVQALMQPFSTIHPCIAGSPTGIYYQQFYTLFPETLAYAGCFPSSDDSKKLMTDHNAQVWATAAAAVAPSPVATVQRAIPQPQLQLLMQPFSTIQLHPYMAGFPVAMYYQQIPQVPHMLPSMTPVIKSWPTPTTATDPGSADDTSGRSKQKKTKFTKRDRCFKRNQPIINVNVNTEVTGIRCQSYPMGGVFGGMPGTSSNIA